LKGGGEEEWLISHFLQLELCTISKIEEEHQAAPIAGVVFKADGQ